MDKIVAIVLAAGFSSRMDGFKPLLPIEEHTALERAAGIFEAGGIFDIRMILNRPNSAGMYSSIKAVVDGLEDSIDGFFLLPVDMLLVKPSTVRVMARAFSISRAGIIYPCYRGSRGHPVFVASHFKDTILRWYGPGGLNQLLSQFEKEIMEVHVDDPGILMEMDTPGDYRRLLSLNQEVFNHERYGSAEHPLQYQ